MNKEELKAEIWKMHTKANKLYNKICFGSLSHAEKAEYKEYMMNIINMLGEFYNKL